MNEDMKGRENMCMQCGTCTGGCPEAGITPFNIRLIVRKTYLKRDIDYSFPWFCTSCGECTLRCPRDVRPSEVIIGVRGDMVEKGRIPVSIQKALENTYVQKNPWGRPINKRDEWTKELDFTIPHVKDTGSKRLLLLCCIHAYDPRCMVIAQNVAKLLNMAGYEFGILRNEEACCGNEIRRMGEWGLFEELRDDNLKKFNDYAVEEIIALSPHCMNTIKNEYGEHNILVRHYSQVISELIEKGDIKINQPLDDKVIYHDPCFLGKQNKVFDAPREILEKICKDEILEFNANREISLCCEGGGGRMFYEADITYTRTSEKKANEAKTKGAQVITTPCPFCVMTLEDSAKEVDIPVKELSELMMDSV